MGEKHGLSTANCYHWCWYCRAFYRVRPLESRNEQGASSGAGGRQSYALYLLKYFPPAAFRVRGGCFLFTYGPVEPGFVERSAKKHAAHALYPDRIALSRQRGRRNGARAQDCL